MEARLRLVQLEVIWGNQLALVSIKLYYVSVRAKLDYLRLLFNEATPRVLRMLLFESWSRKEWC